MIVRGDVSDTNVPSILGEETALYAAPERKIDFNPMPKVDTPPPNPHQHSPSLRKASTPVHFPCRSGRVRRAVKHKYASH